MNQDTILQSNLLDIIFENRNKDYGAYTLRKTYNGRLRIALFLMMGISILFSLWLLSKSRKIVFAPLPLKIFIPDIRPSEMYTPSNPERKSVVKVTHAKRIPVVEKQPVIVASNIINKLPATLPDIQQSLTNTNTLEDFPSEINGHANGRTKENASIPIIKSDRSDPVSEVEIMPQYPGGIKALLAFLKKNLHAPEDIEEGRDISVKIKFVVDYDGKPESFEVLKSGGTAFDNEIVRVLKKMPLWIPGKSKGENVSVYYVVPVKFTSDF